MTRHTSKIGAHISIAGGVSNAPLRAHEEKCETFQCFTRSPQGGPAPELTTEIVTAFRAEMEKAAIDRFYIHAPYYINLASLEGRIYHSSIKVIRQELERGTTLGATYVMFHPGSYKDQTLPQAIAKVHQAMAEILKGYGGSCQLLVEISAGAGNVLGATFKEVEDIIGPSKGHAGFGGICFDTCHAFASGYDFRTTQGAAKVLKEFDDTIGLSWLKMSHVQDSKADLGGKKDRHEHVGKGFVGHDGLAALLATKPFSHIDWILETEPEGRGADIKALKHIRG